MMVNLEWFISLKLLICISSEIKCDTASLNKIYVTRLSSIEYGRLSEIAHYSKAGIGPLNILICPCKARWDSLKANTFKMPKFGVYIAEIGI